MWGLEEGGSPARRKVKTAKTNTMECADYALAES